MDERAHAEQLVDRLLEERRELDALRRSAAEAEREELDARRRALDERERELTEREAGVARDRQAMEDERRELESERRRMHRDVSAAMEPRERALAEREEAVERREDSIVRLEQRQGDDRRELALWRSERVANDALRAEVKRLQEELDQARRWPAAAAPARGSAWNLHELEAWLVENGTRYPDQLEVWKAYLRRIGEYAAPDGTVPSSFDQLLTDVFGAYFGR